MYTLLAETEGHWGGPWFLLFPLFWLLVVAVVVFTLRRTAWRRGGWGRGPLATLGDRYANGDIDADEYRARRAVLTERHQDGAR